jgi:protein SCO1
LIAIGPRANVVSRVPRRSARWAIALGGLALTLAVAALSLRRAASILPHAPAPVYGRLPTFRLIDEHGEPYTPDAMLGQVSVVDFIFTRCPSSCPRLTSRMGELQARFARDKSSVRLVSFSVDPENDTPAVLADYAAKAGADLSRWTFVTGAADDIARTVVLGFKVSAAKIARGAEDYEVTHGNWFVLVDRKGALRGYFPMDTADDFENLVSAATGVERER